MIEETLRLYPPAHGVERKATADVLLGGFKIPSGTSVGIHMTAVHRDPKHFEHPEDFRPERWEAGNLDRTDRFAFVPFGAGARRCLGDSLALMLGPTVLAAVAERFRLVRVSRWAVRPVIMNTLTPRGDLRYRLEAR